MVYTLKHIENSTFCFNKHSRYRIFELHIWCTMHPSAFRCQGFRCTHVCDQGWLAISELGLGSSCHVRVGGWQAHTFEHPRHGPLWPEPESPQPASMQRPRYDGCADSIADALRPFVNSVRFFKYGEKANAPVESSILVAHKLMIGELSKLSANLAFKKESLQTALQKLAAEKRFEALSSQAASEDWVQTMEARIRIACRHVAKARVQKHPPRWLQDFDGLAMAAVAGGRHGAESQDSGSLPEAGGGRQGAESQDSGSRPEADGRQRGAESQVVGSAPEADGGRHGAESEEPERAASEEPEASLQY